MKLQELKNIIEEAYYEFLIEGDSEYSPMAYAKKVASGKMSFLDARKESEIPFTKLLDLVKKLNPSFKGPSLAEDKMYERVCRMKKSQLESMLNELETQEFLSAVEDEFDIETLQLMKGVIQKRLDFLNKAIDIANPRTVVKGFIKEAEGDEETPEEETPAEEPVEEPVEEPAPEAPEEPADPTVDILEKFPTLKKTLTHLLTTDFDQFVEKIGWVSPKPSTFKVEFKNGQDMSLKWMGKGFEATVEGKRYFLENVAEYQQCLDKIGSMLASGPIQSGFEAESPEFGAAGGGGEFPGAEAGAAAPGAEAGAEAGTEAGEETPAPAAGGGGDVFAGL